MAAKVGVDTGGTCTDFIYVDEQGFNIAKVLSTPDNPAHAVLTGLRQLAPSLTDVNIVHGSMVVTNALLERKGARTALITTKGFEDVLGEVVTAAMNRMPGHDVSCSSLTLYLKTR